MAEPSPSRLELGLVAALVGLHLLLCWVEARHQAPTVDEFHLVPQAVTLRASGDLELGLKTPPFLKRWVGLALDPDDVTLVDPRVNGRPAMDGWEPWIFATRFMQANGTRFLELFRSARAMMLPLAALLALAAWAWARRLGGPRAGLVALVLVALAPETIAFGSLVSLDLAVTALLVAALFLYREQVARGGFACASAAGLLLGLALSVKTAVVLVAPVFLLGLLPLGAPRGLGRRLAELAACVLAALVALHATFGFHEPFPRVAELSAVSSGFARLKATLPGALPLPLPGAWLRGFDLQGADVEIGDIPSYLDGQWSSTGWKRYYLLAWLYKTPLALLGFVGVVALGAVLAWRREGARVARGLPGWADAVLLLGPLLLWGGVFALTGKLNIGVRYVLPCYVLGFVALGVLAARLRARSWAGLAGAALLVLFALSSLAATPHHLGYFNRLAGGRAGGWKHLVDSNVDWGQELGHLARHVREQGLGRIGLGYFGHVDPGLYGLDYFVPAGKPAPGWYALSVNFLAGYEYLVYDHGQLVPAFADRFAAFREMEPVGTIGGALMVYRVE
ncbi:MAG TPA: hypothetical protein VF530_16500 [Planctomycetota bacterium]